MKIEYTLTKSEFIKANLENKYECKDVKHRLFIATYISPFIFLGLLAFYRKESLKIFLICYIILIFILRIVNKKSILFLIKTHAKDDLYKFSLDISDNDLLLVTNHYQINFNLSSYMYFVESNQYIHIYNDLKKDIFIPKKAFQNDDDKENFIKKLNTYSKNRLNK